MVQSEKQPLFRQNLKGAVCLRRRRFLRAEYRKTPRRQPHLLELGDSSLKHRNPFADGPSYTLQPGVYIGGVKVVGNANVTLTAGMYIMFGGGFSASANASAFLSPTRSHR